MDEEHTWTVTIRQTAGALVPYRVLSASPHPDRPRASQLRPTSLEAICRARATVERARALVSIATDLLRHALFTQKHLALVRRAEKAVH